MVNQENSSGQNSNSENKQRLLIQTLQEHNIATSRGKIYFQKQKFSDIKYQKIKIERAKEQLILEKETLKKLKQKKFKITTYAEWVNQIRERNDGRWEIIENQDSLKIPNQQESN